MLKPTYPQQNTRSYTYIWQYFISSYPLASNNTCLTRLYKPSIPLLVTMAVSTTVGPQLRKSLSTSEGGEMGTWRCLSTEAFCGIDTNSDPAE